MMSVRGRRPVRGLVALVAAWAAVSGCASTGGGWFAPATPFTAPATIPATTAPASRPATSVPAPTPPTTATTAAPPRSTTAPSTEPAVVISRGDTTRRTVALTFDAGADTGFTAEILDTLAAERLPATFGLTGQWAQDNGALVARIAADGHQLINHTFDHRSFTGVAAQPAVTTRAARHDQLARTEAVVSQLTGQTTKPWFRPPYGDYDVSVNADVGAAGYRYNILWTVDSLGWQGLSAASITARCLDRAEPGAIYLFHVGAASQDAAALPSIVAGLRARGFTFGTVADVIAD